MDAIAALPADPDFDAVIICRPNAMHLEAVVEAVQSRRFPDAIEAAHRAIPEIGRVIRIVINFLVQFAEPPTTWWKDPDAAGDLIVHLQGSHSVDTIVWLLDAQPASDYCRSRNCRGLTPVCLRKTRVK